MLMMVTVIKKSVNLGSGLPVIMFILVIMLMLVNVNILTKVSTLALASLAASASAAIARCSWTGSRASLLGVGEDYLIAIFN